MQQFILYKDTYIAMLHFGGLMFNFAGRPGLHATDLHANLTIPLTITACPNINN